MSTITEWPERAQQMLRDMMEEELAARYREDQAMADQHKAIWEAAAARMTPALVTEVVWQFNRDHANDEPLPKPTEPISKSLLPCKCDYRVGAYCWGHGDNG